MVNYVFSYFLLGLIFLVPWIILFYLRKDVRKEMLIMSFIFGIAGLLVESTYVNDWWKPLTITGTIVGIEDFLFGFVIGGIASVIYEEVWKKKVRIRKGNERSRNINFVVTGATLAIIFFGAHYLLGANTFIASLMAYGHGIITIWLFRKDLIQDSMFSGILLLTVSVIAYSVLELITPGWASQFWYFKNVPEIFILNLPIDDFIWYFLAGAYIGPLYEYWQEGRLR